VTLLSRLSVRGRLYAFDVDPSAVAVARQLEQRDSRFRIIHQPFSSLANALPADLEVSGVLMDLGFSSPQMDQKERGISSSQDGPVDFRYNQSSGQMASDWLMGLSGPEISWVVRQHGEYDDPLLAARIGEEIHQWQCMNGKFQTTGQLADVIYRAKRNLDDRGQHPAKLTFQSIRTWMNQEFFEFEKVLEGSFRRLKYGGRCVVICFKRQETMTLTRFAAAHEEPDPELVEGWPRHKVLELYPLLKTDTQYCVKVVCLPIAPTEEEVSYNNRARSARTHVLEKRRRRIRWNVPADYRKKPLFRQPTRVPVFGGAVAATEPPEPPDEMPPDDIYCSCIGRTSTKVLATK